MPNGDAEATLDRGTTPAEKGLSRQRQSIAQPCAIKIASTASERSFLSDSSGTAPLVAKVTGNLPAGIAIEWLTMQPDPDAVAQGRFGTVWIDDPTALRTTMRPRDPNRTSTRVVVERKGKTLCQDDAEISVPQYFWVQVPRMALDVGAGVRFFDDLERLGLRRRRPDTPQAVLTDAEEATNFDVTNAVIDELLDAARSLLSGVNVRFVEADPTSVVGAGNYSDVFIGGFDDEDIGATENPADPRRNRGKVDVGNLEPSQLIWIFSRWAAARGVGKQARGPVYEAIFNGLAIEDHMGRRFAGTPVQPGDFATIPTSVRQRTVRSAIIAVGAMLGHVLAHECGHALGLRHNGGDTGEIMDDGRFDTFERSTGITAFDPATGRIQIGRPTGFGPRNSRTLKALLPVLG